MMFFLRHEKSQEEKSVHNRRIRAIAIFELFLYAHAQAEDQ